MTFDYQPVLEGRLVVLRPLRPDDFESLFSAAADPLIWEQHPVRNRHEEPEFRAFFDESLESGGALVVTDVETGATIGSSRYHGYDGRVREVEIGWTFLARSHWGGRYNGEMKRLMVEHAFRFVRSVIFLVGVGNLRSRRAVEKIGAVRAGSRPDAGGRESCLYRLSGPPAFDATGPADAAERRRSITARSRAVATQRLRARGQERGGGPPVSSG